MEEAPSPLVQQNRKGVFEKNKMSLERRRSVNVLRFKAVKRAFYNLKNNAERARVFVVFLVLTLPKHTASTNTIQLLISERVGGVSARVRV